MVKTLNISLLHRNYFEQYKKMLVVELEKAFEMIPLKNNDFPKFDYYLASASTFSSNIEGNSLDFDTFLKNKEFGFRIKEKEMEEIEDLILAYQFAQKNEISIENVLKTQAIYAKTFVPAEHLGKVRTQRVGVGGGGVMVYLAIEPDKVKNELEHLFADIKILQSADLSVEEVFYFAAMIHLVFVMIHPFIDGNGRATRLLEKWFLASKLGAKAWNIELEKNYFLNKQTYYKNLKLGSNYHELNYDLCLPFLGMLPESLKK
jgi:Fic family protein